MKISIVIPCYNSEQTIKNVINNTIHIINNLSYEYEIICVNDNSKDNLLNVLKEIAVSNRRIKVINLIKNCGQHNAIMAGLNYASGEYVMVSTDDGQTPIDKLPHMIEKLENGADVVCIRYDAREEKRSLLRKIITAINLKIENWLIPHPKNIYFSVDFISKKYIIDELIKYDAPYSYIGGLVFRTTQNVENVSAQQNKRGSGKSGYTMSKLLSLWLNEFTTFSLKPIHLIFCLGIIFILTDLIWMFFSLVINGFSMARAVISLIIFFSSLLIIILGFIGEYVGRIYMYISKTPQYIISETMNFDDEHA